MLTEKRYYGDAQYIAPSADVTLTRRSPRLICVEPAVNGLFINLPATFKVKKGGIHFQIANIGIRSIGVKDSAGSTIGTIAATQIGMISLLSDTTSPGSWIVNVRTLQGSPNARVKTFAALLSLATAHQGTLTVGTVKTIASTMTMTTAHAGKLFKSNEKLLKAILQLNTVFTGSIGSFPVTKIVSPTASGSGDGSLATPWTLKQAAQTLAPGETAFLRGGTYPASTSHMIDSQTNVVNNGSSGGGYITFKNYPGEIPILTATNRIKGSEYLRFDGITFRSSGNTLISTTTTLDDQNHIEWLNCTFDSTQGAGSFTGILIENGTHFLFRNCIFKDWWNGDMLLLKSVQYALVEDCDFSQCRSAHGHIAFMNATDAVIRRCFFRNPWDRVLTLRKTAAASKRVLVEDCAFLDVDWDGVEFHPGVGSERGGTEAVRFMVEEGIFRNNLIVGYNGGKASLDPVTYAYAGALQQHLFDSFNTAPYNRYYNNVVHRSVMHAIEFLYNTSAGPTVFVDSLKYKNNSITAFASYGINIGHSIYPWEGYLFKKNRIYDASKTKTIHIQGEGIVNFTVSEAQAAHSSVFTGNITDAPQYLTESLFNAFDANPALYDLADLPSFFAAFGEAPAAPTQGTGTELALITANSSGTTLTVDDAHWFFAGNQYVLGDEILVGSNAAVRVTGKPTATTLTINSAITVAINDKIYLKRQTKMPNIGLYAFNPSLEKTFQSTLSFSFAPVVNFRRDPRKFAATMTFGTAFTAEFTKETDFFAIDLETGDLSEFTSTVTDSGDLSANASAAMNGTSFGLQVVIDDQTTIYGLKSFPTTWSTDYLRIRLYLDRNTLAMSNSEDFYIVQFRTGTGQVSAYVRIRKTSGTIRVFAAQRDDAGNYAATADYTLPTGSHYIEVEWKRATGASANDGTTKIWVDGTLHDTQSGLDVFSITRPVDMVVGALNVDIGTTGTIWIDEIRVRTDSTFIGAS